MLIDEDSQSCYLYISRIPDRVEEDHISAYVVALPVVGPSIHG